MVYQATGREFFAEDMMADEVISKDVLINRLKRIEGQVRGLQKMIDNGRDCESILTQLAAVRSAIESVGALVLNNYMRFCFARGSEEESANIDSLARHWPFGGGYMSVATGKLDKGSLPNEVSGSQA